MTRKKLAANGTKVLLLGSGELGKELTIELQRLGCEVVACDRYENAPAMQVAHYARVFDMLNPQLLKQVVMEEAPDLVVPEIEAIATTALIELESSGLKIIPTAEATRLTMDREGIRRLAAEELEVPTARYAFADEFAELERVAATIGYPLLIKPIMSSSGKGQSLVKDPSQLAAAWQKSQEAGRTGRGRVIVEEWIDFESEITLLTVRSVAGTSFCPPIGHHQADGDYYESWQPHQMSVDQLEHAQVIAKKVTDRLGGHGVFGVELFLLRNGEVYFSEVSPRPHDTGMVTMISQYLSEFALHARAILGLPVHQVVLRNPGASYAIKAKEEIDQPIVKGLSEVFQIPNCEMRVFGKPKAYPGRRMAVVLAEDASVDLALEKVRMAKERVTIETTANH